MRPSRSLAPFLLFLLAAASLASTGAAPGPSGDNAPARGADELFWVPTLEQALDMSAATGRPIFLMGYSLVGDGTTYTKTSDEACTGVY